MKLNKELERDILAMVQPAKPTMQQCKELMDGWTTYFKRMDIPEDKQQEEFDGIMRARVQGGSISVVAPNLDKDTP